MNRRTMVVVLTILLTLTLTVAAVAAGRAEPALDAAAQSAKPVTLTFLIDNQSSLDGIKSVIAAAKVSMGIDVTIDLRPGGAEGDNIVKTRLATGDMDDLSFYNSGSLFQALNPARNFVDLTSEPFMANVLDSFKQTVSVDGKVYAAPGGTVMAGGWFYNKKTYAQLGLKVPRTWSELVANLETIKKAGKTGIIASYKDSWTAQLIVLADYYNVQSKYPSFAADYTANKTGYATNPAALSGFEKLQQVFKSGYLNAEPLATGYEDALRMLATGEGVHYPMLTFAFPQIAKIAPEAMDDIGFFPQPGDTAASHGITLWMPAGIAVYREGTNVEAAKQWVGFFASAAGAAAYMKGQTPEGPFAIRGVQLPDSIYAGVKDILPYIDSGKSAPALEFVSPIKGPNLPQICVQVGIALATPLDSAKEYDRDVEKQAKQLGLPGW